MKKYSVNKTALLTAAALLLTACGGGSSGGSASSAEPVFSSQAELGKALFNDANLSANRTQSCATCHDPEHAFSDARTGADGHVRAVSLGDDGVSLGDRNAPTATYAMFSPQFNADATRQRFNSEQPDYSGPVGGQFHDGRAATLAEQAGGPPLNPVEMGMADKAAVVDRLRADADYSTAFESFYGADIFADTDATYTAMTRAIAAFERTDELATFDSAYDRFLQAQDSGDNVASAEYLFSRAGAGRVLFFSVQFTNCATCHQLNAQGSSTETFSGYEYHNIGVPVNSAVRAANGSDAEFIDTGLQNNNEAVSADIHKGKFKVPTLRNVAVTAPYMHNGVFRDLETVIHFYDHYLTGSERQTNPETGLAWADPEVATTVSLTELQDGSTLSDDDVGDLICFLRSLTDARYESLLPDDGLCD